MRVWKNQMKTPSGLHRPTYKVPPRSNEPGPPLLIWEVVPLPIIFITRAHCRGNICLIPLIPWSGICSGSTSIGSFPPTPKDRVNCTSTPSCTHQLIPCSTSVEPSTVCSTASSPGSDAMSPLRHVQNPFQTHWTPNGTLCISLQPRRSDSHAHPVHALLVPALLPGRLSVHRQQSTDTSNYTLMLNKKNVYFITWSVVISADVISVSQPFRQPMKTCLSLFPSFFHKIRVFLYCACALRVPHGQVKMTWS